MTPALTPSIAAQWKHNVFGLPEVYNGLGGLDLFQFDLDGMITVDLGIEVSGSADCNLELPTFRSIVPAGNLGAVVLELKPTATFKVSGKVDLRTSVTFTCGAQYRRTGDRESRTSFCRAAYQPLGLSADTGIDATLTAAIDARATLNDLIGVTGNLTARLHAGYHPEQRPTAQLDGKVTFDLGACLICFWKGSPLRISIVSATLYDRVIWSSDRAPDPVPDAGPPIITSLDLPAATLGQPYASQLTTSDNRAGLWSVLTGSLPPGLNLEDDRILGKGTDTGTYDFTIGFTDGDNRTVSAAVSISVESSGSPGGVDEGPAIADLDYCRTNILGANDDGSTDQVMLPFAINFLGTSYNSTYINNNGYLTFDGPSRTYTPYSIVNSDTAIIAPFFADVDTRNPASALVTYGASPDGHTFCVNWVNVGYYSERIDKTNSFQLLITERSDQGSGDFDLTYNYGHISWETGEASGGVGGIGGQSARVGYSSGAGATSQAYEAPGSGSSGALLDGGASSLRSGSIGSSVPGRYLLPVRN